LLKCASILCKNPRKDVNSNENDKTILTTTTMVICLAVVLSEKY
jgi:hypothetical protein